MAGPEVSVRELRQNLSVYLRRVRQGETLAVTSRGERVAVLVPIGARSRLDRLVAEGRVALPEAPWADPVPLVDPGALHPSAGARPLTDVLLEQRGEQDR